MDNSKLLCKKITGRFPSLGVCGEQVNVNYIERNRSFQVDVDKGSHHVNTFLDKAEVEDCLWHDNCLSLEIKLMPLI